MVFSLNPKSAFALCPATSPLSFMPVAGLLNVSRDIWAKLFTTGSSQQQKPRTKEFFFGGLAQHWDTPMMNPLNH